MRQQKQPDPAQKTFEQELFYPVQEAKEPPAIQQDEASALSDALLPGVPIYRIALVREGEQPMNERVVIRQPQDAAKLFYEMLQDKDREYFIALMLDTKNRLIGLNTVSIGILDSALVSPREVFKAAILCNAASIIVCHNHPSGDPTPSHEDKRVTERLSEAGKILNIEVLDHLVIGEAGAFRSLKEMGVF